MRYTPDVAAATAEGIALLISAISMGLYYGLYYLRYRKMKKLQEDIATIIDETLDSVDDFVSEPVQDNPKTAVALSTLVGYIIGNRFL